MPVYWFEIENWKPEVREVDLALDKTTEVVFLNDHLACIKALD